MLSGVMHCMQLWLAAWCFQETPLEASAHDLEALVQRECTQFLVNVSHGPIAELSFWRLLAWKVRNDTVVHPTTTIIEALTTVRHQHVSMRLDNWRGALDAVLAQASTTLTQDLLLGLRAAPQITAALLHDNVSDLRPGHSFVDDPRNDLAATADWL